MAAGTLQHWYDAVVSGSPDPTGNRASPRVALDAFVKVRGEGAREYVFRTRDLSENGLFLYTRVAHAYPFKVGATLDLELFDYDDTIHCEVLVVRVVEPGSAESDHFPTGLGVKIVFISAAQREQLQAMIERARDTKDLY
jgi:hypothetical protein